MTAQKELYRNPWDLPPMPRDYGRAAIALSPGQINRLLNLSLICSVIFLFLVFPVLLYQSLTGSKAVFGLRFVAVLGDSMEPSIRAWAIVLTKETPFSRLAEGDVIVFADPGGGLSTHRVVAVQPGSVITKGDRALLPNAVPVTREMYRSRVVKVLNGCAPLINYLLE